jgi:hypothetical protein
MDWNVGITPVNRPGSTSCVCVYACVREVHVQDGRMCLPVSLVSADAPQVTCASSKACRMRNPPNMLPWMLRFCRSIEGVRPHQMHTHGA